MSRPEGKRGLHGPPTGRSTSGFLAWLAPLIGLGIMVLGGGAVQYLLRGHVGYLSPVNQTTVLTQSVVIVVAAVGMTMIIISGGIDLSVGSVVALTSVTAAWTVRALHPDRAVPMEGLEAALVPLVAVLAGVLAGAAVGAVNGGIITGLKLPPFIATLGMMALARGAAKGFAANQTVNPIRNWISRFTAKNLLLVELRLPDPPLKWQGDVAVSPAVLAALAIVVGAIVVLRFARFGRHVFAIGSNEATARLCGVRVAATKLWIYTAAGALFGLAGIMDYGYNAIGDPTTARGMELDVIAAVVIGGGSLSGGRGSVLGTLVGALLMAELRNFCVLLGVEDYYRDMVVGVVIVAAVAVDRLRHRRAA